MDEVILYSMMVWSVMCMACTQSLAYTKQSDNHYLMSFYDRTLS